MYYIPNNKSTKKYLSVKNLLKDTYQLKIHITACCLDKNKICILSLFLQAAQGSFITLCILYTDYFLIPE